MSKVEPFKFAFLTSFPLDLTIGSGVVRMISGYAQALKKLGYVVQIFHPRFSSPSYLKLAVQRIRFNKHLTPTTFKTFDFIVGSDFDGFTLQPKHPTKIVLNAGILADIVRFEKGKTAKILSHLAKRECQNVQSARLIIVPSQYTASKVEQFYQIPDRQIHVIPLGIDLNFWQQFKQAAGHNKTSTTILCVARQYPRKGIGDLIRAFQRVVAVEPRTQLILIGGGPQLALNQQLAQTLHLTSHITFVGDLSDQQRLAQYYQKADIFCLPSYHETFGLVFLEAMFFELPIVSYASTAIPEVISKAHAFLCPSGDIASLSEKLLTLVQNPKLRKQFGQKGKKKVNNFDWQNSAQQLIKVLTANRE